MANAWDNDPIVQSSANAPWANDEVIARAPWVSDPIVKSASVDYIAQPDFPVSQDEGTRTTGNERTSDLMRAAEDNPGQIIPGAAEALAGGVVGLGETAARGLAGLASGAYEKATGGGFGQGFSKGMDAAAQFMKPLDDLIQPETDFGKAALEGVSRLFEAPQKAAGESTFEATKSPLLAAGAETLVGLGELLMPSPVLRGKGASVIKPEDILYRAQREPEVNDALYNPNLTPQDQAGAAAGIGAAIWKVDPSAARTFMENAAEDIKAGHQVDLSADSLKPRSKEGTPPGNPYEPAPAGPESQLAGPTRQLPAPEPVETSPRQLPGPEDNLSGGRGQPLDLGSENVPFQLSRDLATQDAVDRANDIYSARDQFDAQRASTGQGGGPGEPPAPPSAPSPALPPGPGTALVGGRGQPLDLGSGNTPIQLSRDISTQGVVDRANGIYPLTADKIPLDASDPAGTISRIASAPVAPIRPMGETRPMPENVDNAQHAQAAGSLADSLLYANSLEKGAKIAPKESREIMLKQAEDIRDAARNALDQYRSQYGDGAANHLHQTAAAIFHQSKSRVKPAKPALVEAPSNKVYTVREHGSQGNNVVFSAADKAAAQTKVHALLASDPSGKYSIETTNAIREPSAGGVLQRQPSEVGIGGGERGRVEPGVQRQEAPSPLAEAQAKPQGPGNSSIGDVANLQPKSSPSGKFVVRRPSPGGKFVVPEGVDTGMKNPLVTSNKDIEGFLTKQQVLRLRNSGHDGVVVLDKPGGSVAKMLSFDAENNAVPAANPKVSLSDTVGFHGSTKPAIGDPKIIPTKFMHQKVSAVYEEQGRGKPVPVPSFIKPSLAGIIERAQQIAGHEFLFHGIDSYSIARGGPDTVGATYAMSVLDGKVLGRDMVINEALAHGLAMDDPAWITQSVPVLFHEGTHNIDSYYDPSTDSIGFISADSPRFKIVSDFSRSNEEKPSIWTAEGDIIAEAKKVYDNIETDAEWAQHLSYPMEYWEQPGTTPAKVQKELWARLNEAWADGSSRAKLEQYHPIAFDTIERLHNELSQITETGAAGFARAQQALRDNLRDRGHGGEGREGQAADVYQRGGADTGLQASSSEQRLVERSPAPDTGLPSAAAAPGTPRSDLVSVSAHTRAGTDIAPYVRAAPGTVPIAKRGASLERESTQGEPDYQALAEEVGKDLKVNFSDVVSHIPPRKSGSVRERIAEVVDDAKKLMAPASRGPLAGQTADILRHNMAQQAQDRELAYESLRKHLTRFIWKGKDESRAFIAAMEGGAGRSGLRLTDPKMQKAAEDIGRVLDYRREQVRALGTGALQNFYENYFPHIWKDPRAAAQFFGRRPLEGSKNFLKQRTYNDFMDGINVGHLEPLTENPVALALLKARELDRFIYGQRIFQELKNEGIIQLLPWTDANGNRWRMPPGYEALNDKIARSTDGQWIAPEQAATIFNNHLSSGLQGNSVYDIIRSTGNMLNAAQLGFSAFHLGFTTADAMISKAALGFMQASRGIVRGEPMDIGRGLVNIARGAIDPTVPVENIMRGNRTLNQYMGRAPHAFLPARVNRALGRLPNAKLARQIEAGKRGGMWAYMDDSYRSASRDALLLAISDGKWGKAAASILPTIIDSTFWPIMQVIVPRQKLGVMMDMVSDQLRANPTMTLQQERATMRRMWDSVDNRMGQLAYDNTFWKKMWKDALMVTFRSVGWNVGDWRELPGGVLDLKNLNDIKRNGLSPRTAYIIALSLVPAIWGAITQYLYTGEGPRNWKDLYAPRTGKIRPDGSEDRVYFPTYVKDVLGYGTDIVDAVKNAGNPFSTITNKLHPLISTIMQLASNKDFFGGAIRIPGEGGGEQVADVAKYLAKQGLPFGVRNYQQQQKLSGNEQSVGGYVTSPSFYGITPAPGYITKDEAQAETEAILKNKDAVITRLREDLRDGADPTEIRQKALRFGLTQREIGQVMSAGRTPRAPRPRHYQDQ